MAKTKTTRIKAGEAKVKLHILEPRATEKAYREETKRTYVFAVKPTMGKQEIAKMVEKEFSVKVTDIRTLIRDGKPKRYSKGKHAFPGTTHRPDKKYAYVTLAEGDSIKIVEAPKVEEETKATSAKDAKADKKAEKADKNAGKENK